MSRFQNEYPSDWKEKSEACRKEAGNHCIRCGKLSDLASGYLLTVHHFDGDKANCEWWNLLCLCQRCHLSFQSRVHPDIPYFFEHSDWLKPYVAGFYAFKYEGRRLTRQSTMERLGELLSYECKSPMNTDGPRVILPKDLPERPRTIDDEGQLLLR